jgi:hypothetical protein
VDSNQNYLNKSRDLHKNECSNQEIDFSISICSAFPVFAIYGQLYSPIKMLLQEIKMQEKLLKTNAFKSNIGLNTFL